MGARATPRLLLAIATCAVTLACGAKDKSHRATASLPVEAHAVARAGEDLIAPSAVSGVVSERAVTPSEALDGLVADSLIGQELERREPRRGAYLWRVALARRLSEQLMGEAQGQGPLTEEEIAEFTRRKWWELDRPAANRVVHAVVECSDCADREAAKALAQRVKDAVRGITDVDAFLARIKGIPSESPKLSSGHLQPVALDGRIVALNARPNANFGFGAYHKAFAEAAHALVNVGDQSEVVESPSGYHVMLLTEKVPEKRVPKEERVVILEPAVLRQRAWDAQEEILKRQREAARIEVLRSFATDTEVLLELE